MSPLIERPTSLSTLLSAMKLRVLYCELAAAALSTVMYWSNLRAKMQGLDMLKDDAGQIGACFIRFDAVISHCLMPTLAVRLMPHPERKAW